MATQYAFGKIVTDGLVLSLNAADRNSYPGSGTTWTDMSGNGNNGTLTNGPTFSSVNGGTFVFDGVDDTVTGFTFTNVGANNTTSAIWYKWNGVNQARTLTYLGSGGATGMGFYINNGNGNVGNIVTVLYGGFFNSAIDIGTSSATLVSGVATYLVITRDTATTSFYQNGVLLGTTTRTPGGNTSTLSFSFTQSTPPAGQIPAIQFYNRALSASEVAQNYNAQKSRYGL
jgi:hypothetical protein